MGAYSYSGTAASNTTVDGIGAAGSDSPDNIDNLIRALAASDANLVRDLGGANTASGTTTLTMTLSDASTPTYFDGMIFSFRPASDNAGSNPTLNVDSLGAKTIKKAVQGAETSTRAGDLKAGQTAIVVYRSAWASGAGAFELLNPSIVESIEFASGGGSTLSADVTGTLQIEGYQLSRLKLEATQASTSGTAIDFTDLPSWVKSIDILLVGVSLSGTDNILIQLGENSGFVSTGYTSQSYTLASAPAITEVTSTSGFIVRSATAGRAVTALVQLRCVDLATDEWVCSHNGIVSSTTAGLVGGGSVDLSNNLTQVRITRTGTDTFDAGKIVLSYSG